MDDGAVAECMPIACACAFSVFSREKKTQTEIRLKSENDK